MNISQHLFNGFCHLLRRTVRLRVEGPIHRIMRQDKPKIWAMAHPSTFDPLYIYPILDNPSAWVTAFAFDVPIIGGVLRGCGFIPVSINSGPERYRAYDGARQKLLQGTSIITCPEGKLTNGSIEKLKTGVVRLSMDTDVPIVPIGIRHTGRVLEKRLKAKCHYDTMKIAFGGTTVVRFGDPFYASELSYRRRHAFDGLYYEPMDSKERATEYLRKQLEKLSA